MPVICFPALDVGNMFSRARDLISIPRATGPFCICCFHLVVNDSVLSAFVFIG